MRRFTLIGGLGPGHLMHPGDIKMAKRTLAGFGMYDPDETGYSGQPSPELFQALKRFQFANGLEVDGVAESGGETETAIQRFASSGPYTCKYQHCNGARHGGVYHPDMCHRCVERNIPKPHLVDPGNLKSVIEELLRK